MYKIKVSLLTKFFLSLFILTVISCSKKEDDPEPLNKEEFIQGNFGDEFLRYKYPYDSTTLSPEVPKNFSNSYEANSGNGVINMIRTETIDVTKGIQITIVGIDLDKAVLPVKFNLDNSSRGFVEIQLRDYFAADTIYGKNDSVNFIGRSNQAITLILQSKEKDYVTGTFYGKISSQSGLTKEISNGEFRIQLKR